MYLAFIDESGTIDKDDPQCKYYVLTAMVIQERGIKFLHRETQKLKSDIWELVQGTQLIMPQKFEIHMQEIIDAKKAYKPLNCNLKK